MSSAPAQRVSKHCKTTTGLSFRRPLQWLARSLTIRLATRRTVDSAMLRRACQEEKQRGLEAKLGQQKKKVSSSGRRIGAVLAENSPLRPRRLAALARFRPCNIRLLMLLPCQQQPAVATRSGACCCLLARPALLSPLEPRQPARHQAPSAASQRIAYHAAARQAPPRRPRPNHLGRASGLKHSQRRVQRWASSRAVALPSCPSEPSPPNFTLGTCPAARSDHDDRHVRLGPSRSFRQSRAGPVGHGRGKHSTAQHSQRASVATC